MSNEILFLFTLLVTFLSTLFCFRCFGKKGLYAWIAFSSVVINIEVLKCVDMFGLSVTLGNALYGSTFLCTDILSENYGGKESRKAVKLGLVFQIMFIVMTQMSMLFVPNGSDFVSEHYKMIFGIMPRICFASVTAFFISNTFDTYLYDFIAKHTKRLWLRNNGSTLVSQLLDTVIFTFIGFAGLFSNEVIFELIVTTYLIKMLVSLADTPFAYIGKWIYGKRHLQ